MAREERLMNAGVGTFQATVTPVPEPSTLILLLIAAMGLLG